MTLLAGDGQTFTGAHVRLESTLSLARNLGLDIDTAEQLVDDFLTEAGVTVLAITDAISRKAVLAFARFGKGRGHPAQLNFGNCLSYACAADRLSPILFKGANFTDTTLSRRILTRKSHYAMLWVMDNLVEIPTYANQHIKRTEHALSTLRKLEALTLRIMPTVGGDAPDGASAGLKSRDPARAFASLSRNLRQTQAMAARVETKLAALKRPFRPAELDEVSWDDASVKCLNHPVAVNSKQDSES